MAKKVIKRTNSNSKIIFKSFSENFGEEFEEAKSRVPSISKINSAIGWKNQMTIDEIIDEIVLTNQETFVGILIHRSLDWLSFSTVMHGF